MDGMIGYVGGLNIGGEYLDGGADFGSWRDTQVKIAGEHRVSAQAFFRQPRRVGKGRNTVEILQVGRNAQWAGIRQLYFLMIMTAQRCIFIQSPYFILDASIAETLKAAALSGVEGKVMLTE